MASTARRRPRTGTQPPARVLGAGETHAGHVRERNEDVVLVDPDLGLFAVFDGMGGANAGDVAARMASEQIADYVRTNDRAHRRSPARVLERAFHVASDAVAVAGENSEHLRGMRTTAVACLVMDPTRAVIAHVGDSRAYLLRDRELAQLTRDHSLVQELIDEGKLLPRSARRSPKRNRITRALGRVSVYLEVDVQELELQPGDRLLLCSDGLHGYVQLRSIRRVLAGRRAPEDIARELVELALRGDAPDNVSAVVVAVGAGAVGEKQQRLSERATRRLPTRSQPARR